MNIAKSKTRSWSKTRIVSLGGGTGLSTVLSGLKKYTRHLTGIVTVTDEGGSSGTLRDELRVLPPGDIRNCLVALADEEKLLSKLFQYRFLGTGGLRGHSFGNLFLTAMADLMHGFDRGIAEASKVLAIRGRVLPITLEKVRLRAEFDKGKVVYGETKISRTKRKIIRISLIPIVRPRPGPDVIRSIAEADIITLGPGSLFTSIIPNLLVQGVSEAIAYSSATAIYICNIMTQPWETYGFTASGHYQALENIIGKDVIDYVFINSGIIPEKTKRRYEKKHSFPVRDDFKQGRKKFLKIKRCNFVQYDRVVRHDPDKLARAMLSVV